MGGEMSFLLFMLLLLHLSNGVSVKQSRVEEGVNDEPTKNENDVGDQVKELMQRVERMEISWKTEKANLEKKLEAKNTEVEDLQKRMKKGEEEMKEAEVQFENRVEEEVASLKSELRMEIADFQNQCQAEVKSEVEKVLPTAVEQGLRDLPFEMVCAYQDKWYHASNSIIAYDRITVEFNNSDRPGGADGSMNIETGVFTTVTSGFYIVTFSATVVVYEGQYTTMYLHRNGAQVDESYYHTSKRSGSGYIIEQGSKTVILHLLAGDPLDLRTVENNYEVRQITLCLYMAPAPYGL